MKNVRVYDLEKIVRDNFKDCQAYNKDICIIISAHGVVAFDSEGIGSTYDSTEDSINIYMTDIPPKNIVYTAPKYKAAMTIREVIEATEYRECQLQEYFNRYNYNSRLRSNYHNLLKAIEDIGINYKEYVK